MLNIQKYEKEIRKCGIGLLAKKDGKVISCAGLNCDECDLYDLQKKCDEAALDWMLSEDDETGID